MNTIRTKLVIIALGLFLIVPLGQTATRAQPLGVADGKTPIVTPEGTLIVPPPGAPLAIVLETQPVTQIQNLTTPWHASSPEARASAVAIAASCTDYQAGWYETNDWNVFGGHAGIRPASMPPNPLAYCAGTGMGYTDGVAFGGENSWIQAGIVIFPGETSAKWMCQANNHGALTTMYGPANAYGNGATVYTWFARDSSGVWRTYRYDTGPFSVELGCTITRGGSNGESLQAFGEIQGATSTSSPMGPWTMFDLRYLDASNVWHVPSSIAPFSDACPPYGPGVVSGGAFTAGSGQPCATSSHSYP